MDTKKTRIIEKAIRDLENGETIISLYRNDLTDDDIIPLFKKLGSNATVQEFRVGGNRITSKGAIVLAQSIQTNNTLKLIDLSNNPIQENDGGLELVRSLEKNTCLECLCAYRYDSELYGTNRYNSEIYQELIRIFQYNNTFENYYPHPDRFGPFAAYHLFSKRNKNISKKSRECKRKLFFFWHIINYDTNSNLVPRNQIENLKSTDTEWYLWNCTTFKNSQGEFTRIINDHGSANHDHSLTRKHIQYEFEQLVKKSLRIHRQLYASGFTQTLNI